MHFWYNLSLFLVALRLPSILQELVCLVHVNIGAFLKALVYYGLC